MILSVAPTGVSADLDQQSGWRQLPFNNAAMIWNDFEI